MEKGWCAHGDAKYKSWLYKPAERVFFHVPSSSLVKRHPKTRALVPAEEVGSSAVMTLASKLDSYSLQKAFEAWGLHVKSSKESRKALASAPARGPPIPDEAPLPAMADSVDRLPSRPHDGGIRLPPDVKTFTVNCEEEGWKMSSSKSKHDSEWVFKASSSVFFHETTQTLWQRRPDGTIALFT
jgi:hypothetical protein